MENNELKIQELMNMVEGDRIDEKMQYVIYKLASGLKMTSYDDKIVEEINNFFNNIGEEGTDFERYLDFTKMNILVNNIDLAKGLIGEIEKELEKNFMLPNGDVFSIYRDVAILEALAMMDSKALDYVNDILTFFPKKDASMVEPITELALTIVDTIHLNNGNFHRTSMIKEFLALIPNKKDKDSFRGSVARKMVMRDEFTSTLNENMIYFAEKELFEDIEDKIEKIFTASQIAIAKIMLGKIENNGKLIEEGKEIIEYIKNSIPKNSSKMLKIFRDITLFKIYLRLDLQEEADVILENIKSKMEEFLAQDGKENEKGGVIYFLISSLFLRKFKNTSDYEKAKKISDSFLEKAPQDVKLWSYVDMSTSLAKIGKSEESFKELKNAESYIEFFENDEKSAIIDDIFGSAISENYFHTAYEKFIDELIKLLVNVSKEEKAEISSEFFYSLAQEAINKKMSLSINF